MDYVKRRLEQIRRQGLEEKIEEAMNQQKRSQGSPEVERNSGSKFETFRSYFRIGHNASLVLIGIAAGVAITTVALRLNPGGFDIMHSSQKIDLLNKRVELLGASITSLEDNLTHILSAADSIKGYDYKHVATDQQHVLESADSRPSTDSVQSGVPLAALETPARKAAFTPTHIVATKLNLRPSASLNATPIGVLPTGTKVQKIGENGGWYHVNTETYGKGWCFSRYLNPLL